MKELKLAVGIGVMFLYHGYRMGKVLKIKGNTITVVLAPYKVRGTHTGKKIRIKKADIREIQYRKRLYKWRI